MGLIDGDKAMEKAISYGFKAPDMTVHEFFEDECPEIEAAPIVHAHWEPAADYLSEMNRKEHKAYVFACSHCGRIVSHNRIQFEEKQKEEYSFCPKCGARMDEDSNDW